MNIEIRVNILPWNELRAEYKFPEEPAEIKEKSILIPSDLTIDTPAQPTSEPYIPPPSSTLVEKPPWKESRTSNF